MTSNREMKSPFLEIRPGYREDSQHALVTALRELRMRHELMGCVLITFDGATGRVGVNASGFNNVFGAEMDRLGKAILGAIDDGDFDPTATAD
jgi:hypothetical protein